VVYAFLLYNHFHSKFISLKARIILPIIPTGADILLSYGYIRVVHIRVTKKETRANSGGYAVFPDVQLCVLDRGFDGIYR
jgi:hypothetical protein